MSSALVSSVLLDFRSSFFLSSWGTWRVGFLPAGEADCPFNHLLVSFAPRVLFHLCVAFLTIDLRLVVVSTLLVFVAG